MARVKLLGLCRKMAKREELITGAESVGKLLWELPSSLGPVESLSVLVNGRNISFLKGLETPLGEGDEVTVYRFGMTGWPGG